MRGLLGFVVLLALAGGGWLKWALDARPVGNPALVTVELPRGATLDDVVERLGDANLAPRPDLLWFVLRYAGEPERIEAGLHELPGDARALDLAELLKRPAKARELSLTLVPGESIWEAAQRVEEAGLATAAEVVALAARRDPGLPVGPDRAERPDGVAATWLEGFLYPDTYRFRPDAGAEEVVARATERFREVWGALSRRRASDLMALEQSHDLSPWQLVILASLVEEEAVLPSEQPTIAGVFLNRLGRKMPLQTDPTLVYHPGRVGRPPTPRDRKNSDNPYNTYAHAGLPPGPICSPSAGALEAVLAPERHGWIYFVARRDGRGSHAFARTFVEHKKNIAKYLNGGSDP